MKAGIIGGTGFYDPGLLKKEKELMIATPFGDVVLKSGYYHDQEIL
ncbi:MAG TPA: S-methyl-5'-thioadenosine phosphorylase, partial [Syntrophomonadaceae bacterium]|nr:S-methyl-5'-thioadenosine phosphorylase [Syntrophomonadaceae bacterium]